MEDNAQFAQGTIGQQVADANASDPNAKDQNSESSQMAGIVSDLDRRLRVLEERYGNLRKKLQLTDQNMVESERSFGKELKTFNSDTLELKRSIADFDEKVTIFSSEMDNVALKSDLKVLEKYLAMWNPQMYVTRSELREYLRNKSMQPKDDRQYPEDSK